MPAETESAFKAESAALAVDNNKENWQLDPIHNHPDPFRNITTITYSLERTAKVSLVVSHPNYPLLTYLVDGYQRPGVYHYDFDATGMPSGKYYARLKINDIVIKEIMTKAYMHEGEIKKEH